MKTKIVICMGSSCFARGNKANLPLLEAFLQENGLEDECELVGSCCEGRCAEGPNLKIGDKRFREVDSGSLLDILRRELLPAAGAGGK